MSKSTHSNAIEGNTLSLRETQLVIDYGVTVRSHPLREYLEATNQAEAYDFVTHLVEKGSRLLAKPSWPCIA